MFDVLISTTFIYTTCILLSLSYSNTQACFVKIFTLDFFIDFFALILDRTPKFLLVFGY
jgi:hypothetical protein